MEKKCFKCGRTKPIELFYRHPKMGDGYLGKCKHCTKRDMAAIWNDPVARERIRKYDRERNQTQHRKEKRKIYQRRKRENNPGKERCRVWVGNAIRDKRMVRQPCEICGNKKSEAHHEDYRKPQCVRWLCFKHHREIGHGQKCADPKIVKV